MDIQSPRAVAFDIPTLPLVRSAEIFGSQSGLQIVYALPAVSSRRTRTVKGHMPVRVALDRMLAGTGLRWSSIGEYTVVITLKAASDAEASGESQLASASSFPAPPLEAVIVSGDAVATAGLGTSGLSLGFDKDVLETPRSVSVLDAQALERLGQLASDLSATVPASHTTTRYGVSGTIDVRNVPADLYFRGMKRLSVRGHIRKVTAALDSVEVVGGPAPPIYGMGKLGGYTNVVPKTGRAMEGGYLDDTSGFVQLVTGSYRKFDVSFGLGGPLEIWGDRRGGYYVHGYVEDSGGYSQYVPVRQRLLQAGMSIDDFAGGLRLESGFFLQSARTAGALVSRLTQDVVDDGTYVRGVPLVQLDADGNGAISYREMHARSPVAGLLSAYNQPLMQAFAWPLDPAGSPLPLAEFPRAAGIPQSLYDYLLAHPEADPAGVLLAQGVGGPVPVSGYIPAGMALDPRTVGTDRLDLRRAAAYEADIDADFLTAYFDLIDDDDPRFTVRNQLFFDGTRHIKRSFQPYSQDQRAYVFEQKLTLGSQLQDLPEWLSVRALLSANLRHTRSWGRSSGIGDFANTRTDAMADTWKTFTAGMTPNSTFMTSLVEDDLAEGGYPWARSFSTTYTERGLGTMIDADISRFINLTGGARFDHTSARNVDRAGRFDTDYGTSADPGRFIATDDIAASERGAFSWSASLSIRAPGGWRPYVTFARASLMLDEDDNSLSTAVIRAGHVGRGELREAGVKASLQQGRLSLSAAAFRQRRVDVGPDTDLALIETYTTATLTRGWNANIKWQPRKGFSFSGYASVQSTYYQPNIGGPQLVDARTLGFQDVADAAGNPVYPANAFLYGGRAWLLLPDGIDAYARMQGNPDVMLGANLTFDIARGFGVIAGANHLSRTCSGRLCTVVLPSATPLRLGLFLERDAWKAQLDALNLLDQKMYRSRVDDSLGNVVVRALPGRSFYLTLKRNFSL